MSRYLWRVVAVVAALGVAGPSVAVGGGRKVEPVQKEQYKGSTTPETTQSVLQPNLSCSIWWATDSAGTEKISKRTDQNWSVSLKYLYIFYSFKNAGKGNASNYPVEATIHGYVKVGQLGGSAHNLGLAYCSNDCKFPGTINLKAGANIPVLKVGGAPKFTIMPPSDVLPQLSGTDSVNITMTATGRLVQDNKDCTSAQPFTVIYKK